MVTKKREKTGAWGLWGGGIFGVKRKKVKDIRRKETLETLKRRKKAKKEKKELEDIETKRQRLLAESAYYEAKAKKKRAKKSASFQFPALPKVGVKVKKKRQGRRLSKKRPIRLI